MRFMINCPNCCKCHCELPRPDTLTKKMTRMIRRNQHDCIALCTCNKGELLSLEWEIVLDWFLHNIIMDRRHQWWVSHRKLRLRSDRLASISRPEKKAKVSSFSPMTEAELGFCGAFRLVHDFAFRLQFPLVSELLASHDVRTRAFGVAFVIFYFSLLLSANYLFLFDNMGIRAWKPNYLDTYEIPCKFHKLVKFKP